MKDQKFPSRQAAPAAFQKSGTVFNQGGEVVQHVILQLCRTDAASFCLPRSLQRFHGHAKGLSCAWRDPMGGTMRRDRGSAGPTGSGDERPQERPYDDSQGQPEQHDSEDRREPHLVAREVERGPP